MIKIFEATVYSSSNTERKRFFFLFSAKSWAQNLHPDTAESYKIVDLRNNNIVEEQYLVAEATELGKGLWWYPKHWGTKEEQITARKRNKELLRK
jgi:hypothetical protein